MLIFVDFISLSTVCLNSYTSILILSLLYKLTLLYSRHRNNPIPRINWRCPVGNLAKHRISFVTKLSFLFTVMHLKYLCGIHYCSTPLLSPPPLLLVNPSLNSTGDSLSLQVMSAQTGLSKLVAAAWRLRVCGLLQRQYMRRDHYYHVLRSSSAAPPLDNPDQRITQDVALFTSTLSQVSTCFACCSRVEASCKVK